MGLIFRKKIKIAPGISINLGKKGISSISIGGRSGKINIGKKGINGTASVPGTGISYHQKLFKTATLKSRNSIKLKNSEELLTNEVIFNKFYNLLPANELLPIYKKFIKLELKDRLLITNQLDTKEPRKVILLSIFLGFLGADRFYIGDRWQGILKIFCIFLPVVPLIWWIIDIFYLPAKTKRKNADMLKEKLFY